MVKKSSIQTKAAALQTVAVWICPKERHKDSYHGNSNRSPRLNQRNYFNYTFLWQLAGFQQKLLKKQDFLKEP